MFPEKLSEKFPSVDELPESLMELSELSDASVRTAVFVELSELSVFPEKLSEKFPSVDELPESLVELSELSVLFDRISFSLTPTLLSLSVSSTMIPSLKSFPVAIVPVPSMKPSAALRINSPSDRASRHPGYPRRLPGIP